MSKSCVLNPDRDCQGLKRADEVASDVKALDRKLTEFQQAITETHGRFGGRIGKLEAHNEVQDERIEQIKQSQTEIKTQIEAARREQKDSIAELRAEHRESMEELKKSSQSILEAVTPLKHKVESLEGMKEDVEELKEKPGKTWEDIKSKAVGWAVAPFLAIVAAALGLSKFL